MKHCRHSLPGLILVATLVMPADRPKADIAITA